MLATARTPTEPPLRTPLRLALAKELDQERHQRELACESQRCDLPQNQWRSRPPHAEVGNLFRVIRDLTARGVAATDVG